jgi:HEAT repeat protein
MKTDLESVFAAWRAALASDEPLDRCDAAAAPPGDVAPDRVVAALIPLLEDPSELVRASVAESLGLYPGTDAARALRAHVAAETDALARAYALSSLGLVGSLRDVDVHSR